MSDLEIQILFENAHILVLNKPAGLVTIPGPGYKFKDTLAGWVRNYVGEGILKVGEENRWGIVHRLDKDTSGALVVAKSAEAYKHLKEQFRRRLVKKLYWALVWGDPKEDEFVVDASLARHPKNWARIIIVSRAVNKNRNRNRNRNSANNVRMTDGDARKADRDADGEAKESEKSARTEFRVIQRGIKLPVSPGRTRLPLTFALLESRPITGRTHQIRVHLKHAGYPIVGDMYYSGRRKYRAVKNFLPRLFLHAKSIGLELPDGSLGEFEADLPDELTRLLPKDNSGLLKPKT
ncbi:RluA family pseudouridine synthase [Patescibacteria group bacterium]|nr:RluA family pseudouridine synthase [Patescibacteria group bacterium]